MRFQDKDIGVVGGGATKQLWEMFQAEALQGAVGEEGETCRFQVIGQKQSNLLGQTRICDTQSLITVKRLTCIRRHPNKGWRKTPIEAPDTPLLQGGQKKRGKSRQMF